MGRCVSRFDGLGRIARHEKAAGAQAFGRDIGECTVVCGGSGFRQCQQCRFGRYVTTDGGVADGVKIDALTGCGTRKRKRGFSGCEFARGEITSHEQVAVLAETEERERRQRLLSCLGRRGGIEKGAGGQVGVLLAYERYGNLSCLSGRRRQRSFLFVTGRRGQGQQCGTCQNKGFVHD